ncbi:MAG: wax ester/triacylglycerol synthase family O-acyltransferase [bacterium]
MTKLTATDASFIYAETKDCPMSIASLQYMQLPEHTSIDEFVSSLKHYIKRRAHLVPYLTGRLEHASGVIDHPNWVEDPDFDINRHIYTVSVPAPGGFKQVEQTVARLHEQPLPRNQPLWDIAVLTGLANGQVAYYNRAHHACLDGMAAQASYNILMDQSPNGAAPAQGLPAGHRRPITRADQLIDLFTAMTKQSINSITRTPDRFAAMTRLVQRSIDPSKGLGATMAPCPPTIMNRHIDQRRVFAAGELPLSGVKHLAKHLNCTINDVFLSLCGGALRAYLERQGELPEQTLIAGCPVSLRAPGDPSTNNQVSMMRTALGTDIEDPVERVGFVAHQARLAKATLADCAPLMATDLHLPFFGLTARSLQSMAALMKAADRSPPPVNVVISNVPGPRVPLYSNGARMLSHYPVSIPAHGVGVNITVQSYVDQLFIGVTAATRVAPDADRLRDDIHESYAALHKAVSAEIVPLEQSRIADELQLQPSADLEIMPGNVVTEQVA